MPTNRKRKMRRHGGQKRIHEHLSHFPLVRYLVEPLKAWKQIFSDPKEVSSGRPQSLTTPANQWTQQAKICHLSMRQPGSDERVPQQGAAPGVHRGFRPARAGAAHFQRRGHSDSRKAAQRVPAGGERL
ncbi:MAG: hypothetical protein K0Q87_4806 [Neobacillus sp.]|jgi:hypothetical protein|nr:hypothetical protein [Neobacillus sp.]